MDPSYYLAPCSHSFAALLTHFLLAYSPFLPSLWFSTHVSLVMWLCRPTELAGSPRTTVSSSIKLGGWFRWSLKFSNLKPVVYSSLLTNSTWDHQSCLLSVPSECTGRYVSLCSTLRRGFVRSGWKWKWVGGRGWVHVSSRECRGGSRAHAELGCEYGWSYKHFNFNHYLLKKKKMKLLYNVGHDLILSNKIPHKVCEADLHTCKVTHWSVADQWPWAELTRGAQPFSTSIPTSCHLSACCPLADSFHKPGK